MQEPDWAGHTKKPEEKEIPIPVSDTLRTTAVTNGSHLRIISLEFLEISVGIRRLSLLERHW
jgi:hypothetical protein